VTTRAGRLLASTTVRSLSVDCTGGNPNNNWLFWLTVDGVRVPGALVSEAPTGVAQLNVTLTGVTDNSFPAGFHGVNVAAACENGGTVQNASVTSDHDATLVVLG